MNRPRSYMWTVIALGCLPAGLLTGAAQDKPCHIIELRERVLTPDDGLLLGNGDLSVSVYQTCDRIIWRFGKGDVWDRRLDLNIDPKPAHIDEIARGIRDEGWKCPPYGTGPIEATRGTKNPQRMKELCVGAPPSYVKRPYPCPKPVGELAMQLPADQMGLKILQQLRIEEATLRIVCSYSTGAAIEVECFVAPTPNVLILRWKAENWNDHTRTGNGLPPVWFSLYRWADPTIQAFGARFFGDYRHDAFRVCADPKATPLPGPTVRQIDGLHLIEQTFPPEATFKDGFRYLMAPFASGLGIQPVDMATTGEARLHLIPPGDTTEGWLAVAVTTSSDRGGCEQEYRRIRGILGDRPAEAMKTWADDNRKKAAEFWSRSSVRIADPFLEGLWYETLHARRCAYRAGTVTPGLFLPSTVQDYSHWHGDYHTNYNIQEPFWGDYTANHLELGDAYFDAMAYLLQIGRKIAKDYYNCRGAFIQLTGYPIHALDDPLGCVPMGRMAYMTGWTMNQYWWRYLHTMDKDWLRTTGYPVIRDCALFYTDFLKKGSDGLYHAFPSNQGEDGFTGDPKDYTDRAQIMQHVRYCLRAAIRASEALGIDDELRGQWRDRLDHCAGDDGRPPLKLTGVEKECQEANPPEFGYGRPYRPQPATHSGNPWSVPGDGSFTWYFGQASWGAMQRLRSGDWIAERDMPAYRKLVERWRHPNGLVWGMAIANYGHAGAWAESLGVTTPLQEMMLQSWDGSLRIFPAWPKGLEASFDNFRAEGAFLVGASWSVGRVSKLQIHSERGGRCRVQGPLPEGIRLTKSDGQVVPSQAREGVIEFDTQAGGEYRLVAP